MSDTQHGKARRLTGGSSKGNGQTNHYIWGPQEFS